MRGPPFALCLAGGLCLAIGFCRFLIARGGLRAVELTPKLTVRRWAQAAYTLVRFHGPRRLSNRKWGQPTVVQRCLTLQVSSASEGQPSYQADKLPSKRGMDGHGEPVGSV